MKISLCLTDALAKENLEKLSLNQLTPPPTKWVKFFLSLFSGLTMLLCIGAILCYIDYGVKTSAFEDYNLYLGIVLTAMAVITGVFSFYQESKSFKNFVPECTLDCPNVETIWQDIHSSRNSPSSLRPPEKLPAFMCRESMKKGSELYLSHIVPLSICSTEAMLVMALSLPNFLVPSVVGRKSHTKELAKIRYEDTAAILYSWYLGQNFDEMKDVARRFARVNWMHKSMGNKLKRNKESIEDVINVTEIMVNVTKQEAVVLEDISSLKLDMHIPVDYHLYTSDFEYFSQMDFSLAQYAFFGNIVLFPSYYGLDGLSDIELRDFLHIWRVFPAFLGMEDRFSLVRESVETTRKIAKLTLDRIIKPGLLNFGLVNLHMVKMAAFPGMDPIVTIFGVFRMVGLNLPRVWGTFSWQQRLLFHVRYTVLPKIYQIPLARIVVSLLTQMLLKINLLRYRYKTSVPSRVQVHLIFFFKIFFFKYFFLIFVGFFFKIFFRG